MEEASVLIAGVAFGAGLTDLLLEIDEPITVPTIRAATTIAIAISTKGNTLRGVWRTPLEGGGIKTGLFSWLLAIAGGAGRCIWLVGTGGMGGGEFGSTGGR